ncbi:MAG: ferredoxin family protein [Actinobacteria bacterium]|nr:ferredoxin family protein [Actinomycetota bacterium]
MNEVKIDLEACNGCRTCYEACFADVLRWDEAVKRPIVAYPEDCVECNVCELNCPGNCIEVVVDWDKYYPPVIEGDFRCEIGREV